MIPVESQASELGLRDYARTLWERKWTVVLTTVLATVLAGVISEIQHPVYEGTAQVLAQPSLVQTVLDPSSAALESVLVQTDVQLFSSAQVQAAVRATLGSTPAVTPTQVGTTGVIDLVARASSAKEAAAVANAYANSFVAVSQSSDQQDLSSAVNQITGQLDRIKTQIAAAGAGTQRASLVAQETTLQSELNTLQENATLSGQGVTLLTSATPDSHPVAPKRARNIGLGFAVGLLIGIGLAFLRHYLDDSVVSREDLDRASGGLTTVGVVPLVNDWKDPETPMVVSLTDPNSSAAEAYRGLRTAIQFAGLDKPLAVIQVTSAKPGEGKTTTVANLAVALARAGQRVAIVSCDLRRPRIHSFFGVSNDVGFTSVALGRVALADAVQNSPFDDRILVLASGPVPPNPSELLASNRALEILAGLGTLTDVVLVDSPPVLPVTDAAVLARRVDGTLLVATAGTTTRKDLTLATEALRRVGAPLVGTILNSAKATPGYSGFPYGAEYNGDYSSRQEQVRTRSTRSTSRPFGRLVRRRVPLVLALVVVGALIGWFVNPVAGNYQAQAVVRLAPADLSLVSNATGVNALVVLAESTAVVSPAVSSADSARSTTSVVHELSVTARAGSPLVTLTISDPDPMVAESLANAMASSLVNSVSLRASASVAPGTTPPAAAVVTRATIPTTPLPTNAKRRLAEGAVVGLVLSLILSGLAERRRGRIRSWSDAERRLRLPVLGELPNQPPVSPAAVEIVDQAERVEVGQSG